MGVSINRRRVIKSNQRINSRTKKGEVFLHSGSLGGSSGNVYFHPHFPSAQHPYNMHLSQICFVIVALATVTVIARPQAAKRPDVSEDALEMALNDKRYLMRQLKCALSEAPCDPVGRRLKSLAPLVLRGSCPQCSPKEMRQIQKVLAHVQRNFPNEWSKVINQYAG